MHPLTRAHLSAALGLASMTLAASACPTCGLGLLLALPTAGFGFMVGRAVLATEEADSAAGAWSTVGLWSSGIGGAFSALVAASSLVAAAVWGLSIWLVA